MHPSERRAAERFPVSADARCQFVAPVGQELGPARIKNVSSDGIAVLLNRRVEPGATLAVTVTIQGKTFNRTLLVKVAHVTPQAGGSFLVGGSFSPPLTYEELTALVM